MVWMSLILGVYSLFKRSVYSGFLKVKKIYLIFAIVALCSAVVSTTLFNNPASVKQYGSILALMLIFVFMNYVFDQIFTCSAIALTKDIFWFIPI